MRKTAFVILFIALFLISNTLYAEVDPDYAAGLKYYNSKKYEKAIEHFQAYIKKKPDPAGYYLIGYSLYKLKRFDEADDYFKEAFLLDPDFSLEKAGLIKETPAAKPEEVKKPVEQSPVTPPAKSEKAEAPQKPAETKPMPAPKPEPQKAAPAKPKEAPPAPAVKQPPAPAPAKVEPPKAQAPVFPPAPAAPTTPKEFPGAKVSPGAIAAILAGFGMIIFIISIAFYVYFSLCLYLIAKKLNVSAPWTAWIPIVNVWTFVACAGKPWWWVLVLVLAMPVLGIVAAIAVPMASAAGGGAIGIIIAIVLTLLYVGLLVVLPIYLWMLIAENLGRNRWLFGLVNGICWYIFPPVSFVLLGILAFSKSGGHSSAPAPPAEETTQIMEE